MNAFAIIIAILFFVGAVCWCIVNTWQLRQMLDKRKKARIAKERMEEVSDTESHNI